MIFASLKGFSAVAAASARKFAICEAPSESWQPMQNGSRFADVCVRQVAFLLPQFVAAPAAAATASLSYVNTAVVLSTLRRSIFPFAW